MRKKVKNADESLGLNKITLNDLVCFAVSRTLLKYPVFNAHLEDGVLTEFEQVHLGFACDTPRGLLVPVIRSAQALGLKAFSDEAKRLAGRRDRGLPVARVPERRHLHGLQHRLLRYRDLHPPSSNLPQTAILGVGAITPAPGRGSRRHDRRGAAPQPVADDRPPGHRRRGRRQVLRDLVAAIDNIDVTVLA